LSSFAALRSSDGALTIMIISKALSGSTPVTVNLANFSPTGPAQVWQLDASNSIRRLADAALTGGSYVQSVPSQSITLLVVPSGPSGNARPWKPKRKPPLPATPRLIERASPGAPPVTGAATARQTAAPSR
jgi:hypothetical protein